MKTPFNYHLLQSVAVTLTILTVTTQLKAQTFLLNASNYNGYNVSCAGAGDGSITMIITGGTAPYSILWSNGATTQNIAKVRAGDYVVAVTDNANHHINGVITLTEPAQLNVKLLDGAYSASASQYKALHKAQKKRFAIHRAHTRS